MDVRSGVREVYVRDQVMERISMQQNRAFLLMTFFTHTQMIKGRARDVIDRWRNGQERTGRCSIP